METQSSKTDVSTLAAAWAFACRVVFFVLLSLFCSDAAHGQSGLREALKKMDRNENEYIEPDEITPLARPYLEKIMQGGNRWWRPFDNPISFQRIQEAARRYHAERNGSSGRSVRPSGKQNVRSFRPDEDDRLIPGFGIGKVKFPYTQSDVNEAKQTLRRSDYNRDGYIDRREAEWARWTHRNPFDDDLNKDERLSQMELVQRYARRRLLREDIDELIRKAQRVGSEARSTRTRQPREDQSQWWKQGGSAYWLTASLMGRFDANRNGRLESTESVGLGFQPGRIDVNADGDITREELFSVIKSLQEEAGDVTEGLPAWFYERDANRDGQIAMHEFTDEWTSRKHEEYDLLDINGDGLITRTEASRSKAAVGGTYVNDEAVVLPPKRTIISEIEVEDDFLMSDLDVQISITHSNDSFLDAYLTGPDGHRVELFTEVGGSGDHFDQTVFDEESKVPVVKAKPPFKGRYYTEDRTKKQKGLTHFYGQSSKGVWQLVIRGTRSDRFGLLNSWNLAVKPMDETPGTGQDTAPEEGEKDKPKTAATQAAPNVSVSDKGDMRNESEKQSGSEKKSKRDVKSLDPDRAEKLRNKEAKKQAKKAETAARKSEEALKKAKSQSPLGRILGIGQPQLGKKPKKKKVADK